MGRKRKTRILNVYVGTSKVGQYRRAPNGATGFRYDDEWLNSTKAFPISLSMPLTDRNWTGDDANSYFDGLLPDDPTIRDKIAAREQADSAGIFDLLAAIGRDCVGALRFVAEGNAPGDPQQMLYRPVDDKEMADRIASLAANPLGMTADGEDFRISIAGMQEKTAFLRIQDDWQVPLGATPTSHIFKPSMQQGPDGADFSDTPWNEWFCLNLCKEFGLDSATTEVKHFDDKPVIVVERFDRLWRDDVLYRLPQEDICQALGVPPARKYEADNGPGILQILDLLNGSASPRQDRLTFLKTQIVFWLLAAIDGHAKNFSIFITPGGFKLTPLYDVMSASPYPEFSKQKAKLAMAPGDNRHYKVREIMPRHFYQTANKSGIKSEDVDEIFQDLQTRLDHALETAVRLAQKLSMPPATYNAIIDDLQQRAKRIS
jgi:serine/threonine-protein kinase HipA